MSELATFFHLGFRHIVDVEAMDHILFLLALAAIYRSADWRDTLWVVTAFTVGHSITLALAVTGVLDDLAEPRGVSDSADDHGSRRSRTSSCATAAARCGAAAIVRCSPACSASCTARASPSYLKSLFVDRVALPLFGFNVGIELGQIVVLLAAFTALYGIDRAIAWLRLPPSAPSPLRLRVLAVSSLVAVVAARWAIERAPW